MRRVSWWLRLLGYRPADAKGLKVLLFTRAGCHLCEDAWSFLIQQQQRHGFRLTSVDVDESAQLVAEYGLEVPVVVIDGKVRFRGKINPVLWERLLRAESRRLRSRPEPDPGPPQ